MISATVIGLGRIGSAYDYREPSTVAARTHLGAMLAVRSFGPIRGVDSDSGRRAAAVAHWGHRVAVSAELPEKLNQLDVVAICTPPNCRLDLVAKCLDLGVRIIVVEKPLALDLTEGQRIVQMVADFGAELRVNFHRRFAPGIQAARAALGDSQPRLVTMRYSRGLYNYASHHVDLLLDWFGGVESVQAIGAESAGDDPTLSFLCRMQAGFDAVILGMQALDYDQFEVDVFMADHRLELVAGGVETRLYRPVPDRHYAGYSHLGEPVAAAPTGRVSGLNELYAAIAAHLQEGAPLGGCTGPEALAGLRVLEAARRSAALGGLVVELERRP